MKFWKKALIAVVVVLLAVDVGVANYLVSYAIGRSGDAGNRNVALAVEQPTDALEITIQENREAQQALTADFLARVNEEPVEIRSTDGLRLTGGYFAQSDSHRWAIAIHGYRGNHTQMYAPCQRFYDAGYQVLTPDLRGCGQSEGSFVSMGWDDRKDMLLWIDWILQRDPQAQIVLYGISMGGATTMMTAGEDTPDAVKVFVEDCGYTSVWDIFASELKLRFHLPEFPILHTASAIARLRAGWSFGQASSEAQLQAAEKPMLFIHGDQDDFVPFWMLQEVYDAKTQGEKEMIIAPGAGHGGSRNVMGEEYWEAVFAFIDKHM